MKTLNESITDHTFFHGMKSEHLALLAEGGKTLQFKPGDVLFRKASRPASST
jgi:hypothetical protein